MHLDVGHDVSGSYAMNLTAAVEILALGDEIAGLLGLGDGKAPHGGDGNRRMVVDAGESVEIARRQVARVTGERVLDRFGGGRHAVHHDSTHRSTTTTTYVL